MLSRLPDGTRVIIRAIRPGDKPLLAEAALRLSPESSRRRFLTVKPRLSARELRYLTEIDGDSHVALVAVLVDQPDVLVAVARYVRLVEDPATAEAAVVVGDALQGQGLGTRLGLALADHARTHGVARFTATMLSENPPAHRLFARISARLHGARRGEIDELVAELAA